MTTESQSTWGDQALEIVLDSGQLPVSSISSLLRVLQAALREVARGDDGTRHPFTKRPQPVLQLSAHVASGDLSLRFTFADPLDSAVMARLSSLTFNAFFEQFGQLLKDLPQRGLWGESVGGGQRQSYASQVERRLDEVRLELKRFPRARLILDRRSITFEGDRMEIR